MMELHTKNVRKGINKAYLKIHVNRADLDRFKHKATAYLKNLSDAKGTDEEHRKAYLRDFLNEAFYQKEDRLVNTSKSVDLSIYSGKTTSSTIEVIVETKLPGNHSEMISFDNINAKSFQQSLHYYFEEREQGNDDLKHIVITNYTEFFIFDAQEIERHFYSDKSLLKVFRNWKTEQKVSSGKPFMYGKFSDFINNSDAEINAIYLNLAEYESQLQASASEKDKELIPLYKLFSPEHLVKKPFANDSNSLDKGFYNELLHILGLREIKEKGSRLIQRLPKGERNRGSLIENTIEILRYDQHMNEVREAKVQYGSSEDDQLFGVALELVITWMNRVLFLKLMEAQLLAYHSEDSKFKFLSFDSIDEYDELEKLFFRVLALRNEDRPPSVQERFGHIPYLNSSLFDATKLERKTIHISALDDKATLEIYSKSILKKGANSPKEFLKTLDYLLRFLNAYNFSAESSGGIQTEEKTLINASVLGLIFEKINGYKDGSFFTPGFITEYMAKETLRKAVLDKFNERFDWNCEEFDELKRKVATEDLIHVNDVVNSITICDPAVGSGHFLVSCLNELIAIKSDLKILCNRSGSFIPHLDVAVENDEMAVEYSGKFFEYNLHHKWINGKVERKPAGSDVQKIQEALFHEKKYLIENCLFGVDINPNSVKICRLRLWIELLKHAYYRKDEDYSELEVLPNIDINIKQGNSLVSRFGLGDDLSSIFKKSDHSLQEYKDAVRDYKETRDRQKKGELERLIDDIKEEYSESLLNNKPINKKLSAARAKYNALVNQADIFGKKASKKEIQTAEKKLKKLEEQKTEEEAGEFYREAFEWRFEFPEVLDNDGNFTGFDVVIGNPPYIRQEQLGELKPYLKTEYNVYAGTADLYAYFIEKGIGLLKENGYFHYIVANKWMRANYGQPLRTWLQERKISSIVDFGDLPVFEEATTYPCLLEIKKEKNPVVFTAMEIESLPVENFEVLKEEAAFEVDTAKLSSEGWSLVPLKVQNLLEKLKNTGTPLGEYVDEKIYRGVLTGYNKAFVIDQETKQTLIEEDDSSAELIKPFLAGRDIKRYQVPKPENYLIFTRRGVEIDNYPAIKKYLEGFKEQLNPRPKDVPSSDWAGRKPGSYKWYEIQDAVDYYEEFEKPKIVYAEIASKGHFTFEESGFYYDTTGYIIPKNESSLVGLFNSKLWLFLFSNISSEIRGGFFRWKKQYMENLPITEKASDLKSITLQILTAKKENPDADTSELEAEMDQLVYKLYGLTEEEITIVEESADFQG